jgi:hypothetical protein
VRTFSASVIYLGNCTIGKAGYFNYSGKYANVACVMTTDADFDNERKTVGRRDSKTERILYLFKHRFIVLFRASIIQRNKITKLAIF